ncbi:MAG: ribonuclease R [Candidatus Amoebophilus sp. 36-38]|nr:MAG: ribonuclease R [Candidatus Amoebophilus sp. 36-38]
MSQEQKRKQVKKHTNISTEQSLLLKLLQSTAGKGYTLSKLYKHFKGKLSKAYIQEALAALVAQGAIEQRAKGKFVAIPNLANLPDIIGKVDYVNPGYAYVVVGEGKQDVLVRQKDLLFALDGDLVKVVITQQEEEPKKHPVGRVVEILERNKRPWVGTVQQQGAITFIIPISRRMHYDIFIRPENLKGAKNNDRVVVELINGPTISKNPEGKIVQVFGPMGEHEVEIHTIMAEFNLPMQFPKEVLAETKAIPAPISLEEIAKRKDYRDVFTITIDPDDAKDFDDALSLKTLPNGHIEVGVHIADVSYYVREGSLIDEEAFERGTSVYLVDRTISMLPERLSNDLCSLKPLEDRLAFSAVFELDKEGQIHHEWFGETIIHSDKRLTYEEAQQAILQSDHNFHSQLTVFNNLAKKLRAERFKKGAINFDTPSIKFELDKQGRPLSVLPKISQDSHRLVEEFMLLANKRVALHVRRMKQGKEFPTFVYRTHDQPNLEKLGDFALFVKQFGYSIPTDSKAIAQSINVLSENLAGKPESHIIQTLAIRLMAKALYTTEAKPHFGLAFEHYTHFTSPIRRYPDLLVHRLLKKYLQGQFQFDEASYEKKCQHASERERVAADAERASIKYKQVELMQTFQGQQLKGIISSLTDWGMYIELLEILCEGMIRLSDLTDDYYVLDKKGFKLVGERTKKTYQLGDLIQVKIKACDISKRTVDLLLV